MLDTIDEGTLSDGDMEPQVLWALEALEHWSSFLVGRDPEFVVQLAIRSLEAVDHEVSARLDDFLASPEMTAEFDRIGRPPALGEQVRRASKIRLRRQT